jgi:hypothetical protein
MEKYTVIVITLALIVITSLVIAKFVSTYARQKGYKLKRMDIILLIIFCILFVIALMYTYIQTNGTFIWR